MLKRKVLVNGISNLSDARYCAGMFVDYLSFELNPSHPDYIALDKVIEIKNWLSGVKIGGRLTEWPDNLTETNWTDLALDFIIINNADNRTKALTLVDELFFEVGQEQVDLSKYKNILANAGVFESMETLHSSVFVGPDVTLDMMDSLLANENIAGIALKGNHEERPGESSYEDLMDVLEALEEF